MSVDADPGFWKQAASWLWSVLLLPMTALWAMFNSKINTIEAKAEAALPRKDFEEARAQARQERHDLRGDVKELYERGEATKDLINQRVDGVRESVERKIDDLRRDVNGGFDAIRDEIRQLSR